MISNAKDLGFLSVLCNTKYVICKSLKMRGGDQLPPVSMHEETIYWRDNSCIQNISQQFLFRQEILGGESFQLHFQTCNMNTSVTFSICLGCIFQGGFEHSDANTMHNSLLFSPKTPEQQVQKHHNISLHQESLIHSIRMSL